MELTTFIVALLVFISWGLGSFIAKLATNRIGERTVFFDILGYTSIILIYSLLSFKAKVLLLEDKLGILLGILAGLIGAFGLIGFYFLLTRKEASIVIPLTALYPALTVILSFIFLKESLNLIKIIGVLLALFAVYLLSI